jgi:hypothetical protein
VDSMQIPRTPGCIGLESQRSDSGTIELGLMSMRIKSSLKLVLSSAVSCSNSILVETAILVIRVIQACTFH